MPGLAILIAAAALAGPVATPHHILRIDDATLAAAGRCQGLMTAPELGPFDPAGINRFIALERGGRPQAATDRADAARDQARREAATATSSQRRRLIAERDSRACRAFAHGGVTGEY
jgi:hypothetical protein